MFASLKLTSILLVIECLVSVNSAKGKVKMGPSGMSFDDTTNCSEFSKFGRFHPYSVLHEKWFVFYYWAPPKPATTFIFTFPTANHTKYLKKILDGNTVLPVMWSARQILIEDHNNETALLVERSDRGEYWLYPLYKVRRNQKITPRDIRLKQTGDSRILGLMDCEDESLMVMARINDVPPQNRLQEEASRLGYRGRRGKSYLYQGHEWMPIPEDNEKNYWFYKKERKGSKESSKEVSEQSSEETNLEPTKEPEDSKEKEKSNADSQVFNEEELQSRCYKIEPELWNDPKPNPSKDAKDQLISVEELNSLDTVLDTTPSIDAPDSSLNNKEENNLANELENTKENNKIENQQDSPKMPTSDNTVLDNIPSIDAPDSSLNNKQEKNLANELENTKENNKIENHQDSPQMKMSDNTVLDNIPSIDAPDSSLNNKQENNLANELENTQESNKIENYQDSPQMPMSDNTVLDNIPSIDAQDSSLNNKQEKNLANELENTQENNKIENHQDSPKMPMSDKTESSTQPNEENCDICYESSHYIQTTSEPYRPENTLSITNLGNDVPPRTDVPAEPVTPQDSNSSDIEFFTIMSPKSLDDLS